MINNPKISPINTDLMQLCVRKRRVLGSKNSNKLKFQDIHQNQNNEDI